MRSGNINIKASPILRILVKWVEELTKKASEAEKYILEREYSFKTPVKGTRSKLSSYFRKKFSAKLTEYNEKEKQTLKDTISSSGSIQLELATKFEKKLLDDVSFIDELDQSVGYFACRIGQFMNNFTIKNLNMLIHLLLKSVKEVKE